MAKISTKIPTANRIKNGMIDRVNDEEFAGVRSSPTVVAAIVHHPLTSMQVLRTAQ